jgi:hypothetical protein
MNNPIRSGRPVQCMILAVAGGVLLSCAIIPSSIPGAGNSGWRLTDPSVGLNTLKSYHASLQQDVVGTLGGSPFERHTQIELTRAPADGNYDMELTLQGSDEPSAYLRILALGKASYVWDSKDRPCQGALDDQTANELIDPTLMLLPVSAATKAGTETVNGIETTHYRFDQTGLPLADPKPSAGGEAWIANQGGYIVKYSITFAASAKPDAHGMRAEQTLLYELSHPDGTETVALPQGCLEVLADIPVMPDAQSVLQTNGMTDFVTASGARQVLDFYAQKLPALGWISDQKLPAGDVTLPFVALFTNGDRRISLRLSAAKPSGVEVSFLLLGAFGSSGATKPGGEATATPGIVPTVEKSESGLPVDVPLYPGATDLSSPAPEMLRFQTDDTPDQVDKYYQEQMPLQNWSSLSITNQQGTIIQVWTKEKRIVSVTIVPQGNKTIVMIGFPSS